MLFAKKINTRGRKREARRWLAEANRRSLRVTFGNGPPRAGTDRYGRTFTERCDRGVQAWMRDSNRLEQRDPVLYAAVMEVMWAECFRQAALTPEQWTAERRRRQDKYCSARARAERQATWRVHPKRRSN